jgi:hypothetical protein
MTEEKTPTPGKTYLEWLADTLKLVADAQDILKDPLRPDTQNDQGTQAEEFQSKLSDALSEASAWLDFDKAAAIGKIDRDLTVMERTIHLDMVVMRQRMLRDKIEGLLSSMKSRMKRAQWHL